MREISRKIEDIDKWKLNMCHDEIKDKGRGLKETRDSQERKAIVIKLHLLEN